MDRPFRPVAIVALALTILPLAASIYFLLHPTSPFRYGRLLADRFYVPMYFFVAVNGFNVAVCVGVLTRRVWGYRLFLVVLYLLLLGFPIGTAISYFTLSYIRGHHIGQLYFGLPPDHAPLLNRRLLVAIGVAAVALFLWMMLAY